MNEYNETPRRSSIIETDEENALFESTWLSNITEQIDKQMIAEFEKTIRRKVSPSSITEIRRDEPSPLVDVRADPLLCLR